jgi:NAD(P)-dependent dehydrogenase (short-subunit alcohol dehydrogenase family)
LIAAAGAAILAAMSNTEECRALVTGAGRRIGRAIAIDLAAAGWDVAVHYHRSAADAGETCAAIVRAGGRAAPMPADLACERETAALVGAAAEALGGPLRLLVNNASVFEADEALTATRASWDRHLDTNLRAPLVLTQDLVRGLPAGATANVINILDQRVWRLTPYFLSYTVSKTGLWTLTRTLAMALAPRVRVNAIGPGPTLPSPRQTEAQFARQWQRVPLRRPVAPEEICAAVRFILDAPSLTGQMIALDAGQHLAWAGGTAAEAPEE